ncbi:hypothetical protein [Kitasatospora indigofera]|uniref:hypothetical protein n=1 Tax=Kitasatospora indigofera TaxID=67307 RepID=UPI00167D0E0C|nr:hypothetical protein [Kitasatospora indigofera]
MVYHDAACVGGKGEVDATDLARRGGIADLDVRSAVVRPVFEGEFPKLTLGLETLIAQGDSEFMDFLEPVVELGQDLAVCSDRALQVNGSAGQSYQMVGHLGTVGIAGRLPRPLRARCECDPSLGRGLDRSKRWRAVTRR